MRLVPHLVFLSIAGALAGCGTTDTTPEPAAPKSAKALLKDKAGLDVGTVSFLEVPGGSLKVTIEIASTSTLADAGQHALHIHAVGACDPPDFTTAMGHWNPTMEPHGSPASGAHHAGDLGNVMVDFGRRGTSSFIANSMALTAAQSNSIVGLVVLMHAKQDDFVTQMPPGNAGARIACGMIALSP